MSFLVIKALHIVAVVAWFAGLFYLPRLFVYHATRREGPCHALLCTMEQRLYRYIMRPAMLAVITLGAILAWLEWDFVKGGVWFWLKLLCVGALLFLHWQDGRYVRAFAERRSVPSERFFRLYNEAPTLLLVAIVLLVVLKPW